MFLDGVIRELLSSWWQSERSRVSFQRERRIPGFVASQGALQQQKRVLRVKQRSAFDAGLTAESRRASPRAIRVLFEREYKVGLCARSAAVV